MPNHMIRRLAILGAISIIGIVLIQGFTLYRQYDLKDTEFDQTVRVALYQVARKLAIHNNSQLPKKDLVIRKSANYYAVNINDVIDANILEDYLIRELDTRINVDFEFAVYDCQSSDMVYGKYCKLSDPEKATETGNALPTFDNLIYYFVVGFPSRRSYLVSNIWQHILYGVITFLALTFFIYSMWVILQQKKLSDLQKDFINNMTHEFKTPISSIKIAANVIKSDPMIKSNERLYKYGQIIEDQNNRLNDQVEKVLNLARLEKDSFKLNLEKFDAAEVLQSIVSAEHLKINEKGQGHIKLENSASHLIIKADKLHFSNVIHNILDNAVKYCERTPEVVVKTSFKEKNLVIDISDNGIGIKPEYKDHLFKKFYRVPTGDIHNVKGFGLGLFYVQNICEAHGWDLQVDSTLDRGSTFSISIPQHG